MTESTLFTVTFILYILSALVYLVAVFAKKEKWSGTGFVLAAAGFALHTGALILRTVVSRHAPFTNMYESLSFLAWASVLALIVLDRKFRIPRVAPYVMLIAVGLVALASSPLMPKEATPLVPALQSYWLWLHVSVTLLGEAFFAVAFVASLLYLRADTEEKKLKMDAVAYRAVAVGFPLFTLGGLIFGMVWAYKAWGTYWSWDPKEVWSLITWIVFALYLHTRIVMGWKGKRSALISIIGFLAALFTYFGVNYLLSGLHSYA
jgi:ABC-type transport system involved in cytochrome c biogenesis permease subunit